MFGDVCRRLQVRGKRQKVNARPPTPYPPGTALPSDRCDIHSPAPRRRRLIGYTAFGTNKTNVNSNIRFHCPNTYKKN
ncbi:hypothetical protein RR46_08403 [Papilio xuthus]|uniref:Uncharacterized protein n=1 Tax=Papilio xuthus TaxID=66420 RepID=A0A194PFB8_PAPXU|nr:hypothetical protein RR46_08403 [Papilio xuthus]